MLSLVLYWSSRATHLSEHIVKRCLMLVCAVCTLVSWCFFYENTCLSRQLLERAQLNVQMWEVCVPTPFCTALLDKETTASALIVHDGWTNVSPGRLYFKMKCSIKPCGQIVQISASIGHQLLISWRPLGWLQWYLTSFRSWLMVPWCHPCQWRPFRIPWWLDGLEIGCINSCVVHIQYCIISIICIIWWFSFTLPYTWECGAPKWPGSLFSRSR